MSFNRQHATALTKVLKNGQPVSFSRTVTPYTAATAVAGTPVTATVTGAAMRTKGNPIKYAALGLSEGEAPTLLFVPDVFGLPQATLPPLDAVVAFGGMSYLVRDIAPLAPDGNAILAKIVVVRGEG